MYQRGRDWTGGVVCAVALALVGWALQRPGAAWAAAEGGHEGGLISLDRSLIVQVVNFVILLVILQRLLYKPFLAKMQERTGAIQKSLEEAQAARAEAARQQEENEARLRAAYAEAAAIRAQALKEAAEEHKRLVDAARAESHRLIDGARAQMEADVRRARDELRREVAELATAVAEKLVRKSLRDEDHRRLLAEAIARVGD
ncbi:MAG: ATP synthase F0 subunit B [Candidatus Rokubacteria bacterium 13_1_20CM_4_70_14]|nr:MAG: ATP synthase F0 subunit B [Candidatus Rokubacteria bacterium 13_1_20CM_4_70_14]PYM48411.1 MAG: ATP synthase F0 subunit B [Candidatus Rokubacteria bacterium]